MVMTYKQKGDTQDECQFPKGGNELIRPASSKPDRDQKPAGWCARREGIMYLWTVRVACLH